MKSLLNTIASIMDSIRLATRATELARSGKWKEAQELYSK